MAIYTYRCRGCGSKKEVIQSIASYSTAPDIPTCPMCPGLPAIPMERYFTPVMSSMDRAPWAGYVSPLDGKTFVDSRAKEREMMARHGVVPFQEIQPDFERNRRRLLQESREGVKQAVIDATTKVDQGYRPVVESDIIPAG